MKSQNVVNHDGHTKSKSNTALLYLTLESQQHNCCCNLGDCRLCLS